jgi:hypothetical protein
MTNSNSDRNYEQEGKRERKNRKPCTIIGKRLYPMMNNISSSDTHDEYLELNMKSKVYVKL